LIKKLKQYKYHLKQLKDLFIDAYIELIINNNDELPELNRYEYGCFSQNGEDGIIDEIFDRIGITNKIFVEFGVGDGNENNTAYLLNKNWKGLWIEPDKNNYKYIKENNPFYKNISALKIENKFVTIENFESLLTKNNIQPEFDFLSIDIDGNDYWIWKSLENFKPRVVVIEYNSSFKPPTKWIMDYNPDHVFDKTNYFGASLSSLEELGRNKNYKLVACDITGTNAFFVRIDLINENFKHPFTTEFLYHPPRYFLSRSLGHKNKLGLFRN
jgi:hypothetical protein